MHELAGSFGVASLRSHLISTKRTQALWLCGDLAFHGLETVAFVTIVGSTDDDIAHIVRYVPDEFMWKSWSDLQSLTLVPADVDAFARHARIARVRPSQLPIVFTGRDGSARRMILPCRGLFSSRRR